MKKIYVILLLLLAFAGGQVLADVVTKRPITKRPIQNQGQNLRNQTIKNNQSTQKKTSSTGSNLSNNVKMCKPYSETLQSNVGGINFRFNIKIAGWVNNKCRVDFVAQSTGISNMFNSIYGFDAEDAQISTFEPKVRCEFTKQQLVSVGDSILQEEERNHGARNNMLKNPQDIDLSGLANLSGSDVGLMSVIMNDRACTILNAGDSGAMFGQLFGL